MTLQELLTAALQQLDRGTDAQTLETWRDKLTRYLNDALIDLTGAVRPRRTERVDIRMHAIDLSVLSRHCIKVTALTQGGMRHPFYYGAGTELIHTPTAADGAAALTYRYMPPPLSADTDVPELPAYCHGALVLYAVARERSNGDASAAAERGFQLYKQMRRAAERHAGEADAYRFTNVYD